MLTILSPAKKLNELSLENHAMSSEVHFKTKIKALITELKKMTVADIACLMKLSEKLAQLNFERYQDFKISGSKRQPSQNAIFLFKGDVYQSLAAETLTTSGLKYAQKHLAILSGLYGLLKPLDLIQPYRLEMGTKLSNEKGTNLYDFWQDELTDYINQLLAKHKNKLLLNLASTEYSKAINPKKLHHPLVTAHFKENKNGSLKVIGIHAKKARGAMARFIITNQVDSIEQLKSFKDLNYRFDPSISNDENLVYSRSS